MGIVIRNRRTGVLATVTGTIVAVSVVLLLAQPGPPTDRDHTAAEAAAVTAAPGVRGPGIPPAPGASQNAPPDPNAGAPTASLRRVANALQLKYRSVSAVVTVPAGVNVTARVTVSVDFGIAARVVQDYNRTNGTRLAATFPDRKGVRRTEPITITLTEPNANGDGVPATYEVRSNAVIEPLYDVTVTQLNFTLINDCDQVGASEPTVRWRYPDNTTAKVSFSLSGGGTRRIAGFAHTYAEVGQSADLREPSVSFVEEDTLDTGFYKYPDRSSTSLVPGTGRTVTTVIKARNDDTCEARISYSTGYKLRRYDL